MLNFTINSRDKAPPSILTKAPPRLHSSLPTRTCTPLHTSSRRLGRRSLQRSLRVLNRALSLHNLLLFARLGVLLSLLDLITEFLEVILNPRLERREDGLGLLDSCSLIVTSLIHCCATSRVAIQVDRDAILRIGRGRKVDGWGEGG